MRRLTATAAMAAAIALLAPVLRAQVRNTPAPDSHNKISKSSTVPARPLGHQGAMPTPIGVSPTPNPAFPTPTPIGVPPVLPPPGTNNPDNGFHHHHRNNFFGGAYPVYVPVPVVVEPYSDYQTSSDQDQSADEQDDQNVVPGPTVFERRTPQDMSDVSAPASDEVPSAAPQPAPSAAATPAQDGSGTAQAEPAQPSSVLVFRDGHQLEVENYAIVGNVLYDFTPGHARKVPLSLLDLDATVKANDDRGVDFVVPASAKGN